MNSCVRRCWPASSVPRKQQMHAAVADAIERIYPRFVNERAGEITDHLLKAGSFADSRKLVRYLILAGKTALEAAAFEEARRSFQSALSYQGALDQREKAELLASLAMAELSLEHWDAAVANLREVLEIYTNLGDREMIGKQLCRVGRCIHLGWPLPGCEPKPLVADSTTSARTSAPIGYAFSLRSAQASAASAGREPACAALREALEIASKLSDPKLEARVLGARSIVNLHFFRLKEVRRRWTS